MKTYLTLCLLSLTLTASAQYYNGHFQLDGGGSFTPYINSSTTLPNGNIAYSVLLYSNTAFNPGNTVFYNLQPNTNSGMGVLVVRPNKTIAWVQTWNPSTNNFNEQISSYKILSDSLGNIYLTGSYQGEVDLDPTSGTNISSPVAWNHNNPFIIKLDLNGNYIWSKYFESANGQFLTANITDANLKPNGDICFAGDFNGSVDFDPGPASQIVSTVNNITKPFLLTLDTNGNFKNVLSNDIGSSIKAFCLIEGYKINQQGASYILYNMSDSLDVDFGTNTTSYLNPTPYVLAKYDTNMQLIWSEGFYKNVKNANIDTVRNGTDFYVFGEYTNNIILHDNSTATGNGFNDIFYEKWDSAGNCLWANTMGGTNFDYITGLKEFGGGLYMLYSYADSINTNTGSNDTTLFANSTDIALSQLDLNGKHIATQEIKSAAALKTQRNGFTSDGNLMNLFIRTNALTDIDPWSSFIALDPQWITFECMGVVQWGLDAPLGTQIISKKETIQIYPNPASNKLNVKLSQSGTLLISSIAGKQLMLIAAQKGINTIDLSHLPAGIYIIQTKNADNKLRSKFTIVR